MIMTGVIPWGRSLGQTGLVSWPRFDVLAASVRGAGGGEAIRAAATTLRLILLGICLVGAACAGRGAGRTGGGGAAGRAGAAGGAGAAGSAGTGGPVPGNDGAAGASPTDGGVLDATVRRPAPHPDADPAVCGAWALVDNVCCAQYCSTDDTSESCTSCGGPGSASCTPVNAKACVSGQWPEVHAVGTDEPWHYSRSTHFGLTYAGACAFGLYGLCTTQFSFTDPTLAAKCDAFCKAYPDLCRDPAGTTLRGNFAAPQGNYYTQFWSSLPGDDDNYLSCGECFELIRTQKDGTDYQPGQRGYTPPVVLQVVDSCPCSANSKWCCGSGRDHCGEVSDFKYGCQLPPAPPSPPTDHDPLPNESVHLDLSDIAMARLQTGDANGSLVDGIIPTRYRRVLCPVVGNMYIWLHSGAGPYWFALSVVNTAGLGSVVKVEAQMKSGAWVALARDPNYTRARPQERYGSWVVPQGAGPFDLPLPLRVSDPSGRSVAASVNAWAPVDPSQAESYYIDTGVQF